MKDFSNTTYSDLGLGSIGNDILEHYGVKGMKWGVRRDRNGKRKVGRKTSSDYERTKKYRGVKPSTLSNNQLQEINFRMQLEQNYMRLNPGKLSRGEAHLKSVMSSAKLGAEAYNLTRSPSGQALVNLSKKVTKLRK